MPYNMPDSPTKEAQKKVAATKAAKKMKKYSKDDLPDYAKGNDPNSPAMREFMKNLQKTNKPERKVVGKRIPASPTK